MVSNESVLRLKIAVGSVIIGERRVSPRKPVVVGLLEDDAQDEQIRLHDLFCYAEGGYCLRLTRRMVGSLTDGKSDSPPCLLPRFNDVKEFMRDKSRAKAGVWEIPLSPGACGQIKIGDFTIQFRFAPARSSLN